MGNEIDVIIMSIDKENRKLQLGHKQIEEDPWNSLEETFPVGSIHEGTVTRKDDKGAIVQLPYGLEGFAPARHLRTEDEKVISVDQIAPFMVIEFDRNDKKIILSHSRIWEQVKADEKNAQMKEKRADAETTKKAVKNIQSKVEKTTLGDLGVLADLKKKMDNEGDSAVVNKVSPAKIETESKKVAEETKEVKEADEPKIDSKVEEAPAKKESKKVKEVEAVKVDPDATDKASDENVSEEKVEGVEKAKSKVEASAENDVKAENTDAAKEEKEEKE